MSNWIVHNSPKNPYRNFRTIPKEVYLMRKRNRIWRKPTKKREISLEKRNAVAVTTEYQSLEIVYLSTLFVYNHNCTKQQPFLLKIPNWFTSSHSTTNGKIWSGIDIAPIIYPNQYIFRQSTNSFFKMTNKDNLLFFNELMNFFCCIELFIF